MKKTIRSMVVMAMCLVLVAIMAVGCVKPEPPVTPATFKQAQYNTTTATMPSNWNELTYQDNNDTQIMSYIGSSFFTYDYKFADDKKFNEDGSINKAGIVEGAYTTNYSAATKLEDVTSTVDAKWGYTDEQKKQGGYAWKITLRNDLKWDDGTAITAADFVYSMQAQLDPKFMNYRANTYYDTLRIKNSKQYFFQNTEGTYELVGTLGYKNNAEALAAGKVILIDVYEFYGAQAAVKVTSFDATTFKPVLEYNNTCPQWLAYNDETYYFDYGYFASDDATKSYVKADGTIDFDAVLAYNATAEDAKKIDLSGFFFSGKDLWNGNFAEDAKYAGYVEVGGSYASWLSIYVENLVRDVKWEDVGIYSIDSENAIVICLDKNYSFLTKDGGLSVWAPYYMSGLPLVHKAKYEAAKIEPAEGATLWTSKYNSSLETTASWGPYKLVEFEAGSHYKLVKNENWYGYAMEENKNQYNITSIYCVKEEEFTTKWMGFLNGTYDDASLETENAAEYVDSKYVYYTSTSTGTFGMQLFSDLNTLKGSENNNGILAIQEFRHAFNLALNRSDIVEKIYPGSSIPCFGLVNVAYYYDIENAPTLADGGQYRNTATAKAGILRAYGFEEKDGKWSSGDLKGLSLEDAYDALTGYNPVVAKEKIKAAIAELEANADKYGYDKNKNITLVYGSSVDNDKQRFRATYIQGILDDLTKGTSLEDKIDVVFDASAGAKWAEAFRSGKTQIGFGYGFQGNAFNPFDIIGAFVNPEDSLNYHMYWNTAEIDMTLTMPAGDYEGAGETITMSVQNWYYCLNGLAETEGQAKKYNWDAGYAPTEARVMILSALEELTIKESRSVMLIADSGGSFLGAKFSYFSDVENVFMGFGGIRYMEVNYTDAEWTEYVKANNNDLTNEYKKSE